jgi:SAM-dependent methyltransferase
MDLNARWKADLESWAIPDEILRTAPRNPWGHDVRRFARRTAREIGKPAGPTYERAREALGESVLDVGAGAGAASLPLQPAELIAVDENPAMLAELGRLRPDATLIEGRWPDVEAPEADVVVCAHVVFNVPELAEFLVALDDHGRNRVVVELPEVHPTSWLNPLWEHFHGLVRPTGPTSDDAAEIAASLGFDVTLESRRSPDSMFETAEEMADSACRRLCLDPSRAPEVIAAAESLGVWPAPPRTFVTMWWDVRK